MAEEGQVIGCHNVESWEERTQKGIDLKKLEVNDMISGVKMGLWLCPALCRLVMPDAGGCGDFTSSWCGPCRVMAPILADIAKIMPHIMFLKVDVNEPSTVAEEWEIEGTFIFLKEGKLVEKIVGAQKEELHAKIAEHAATLTASA